MSEVSQISPEKPLLLLGCGRMGSALLHGWLGTGLALGAVKIVDPDAEAARDRVPAVAAENFVEEIARLPTGLTPGVIILAVKPQMMDQALADLRGVDCSGAVFLSIAAGKTIGYFSRHLGPEAAIVRAMPNIPASVGKGITVAGANPAVSEAQQAVCHDLLGAVGAVEWITDEDLMDAVTAVSGSGPAYVFYLVEALAKAGEQAGLAPELAAKLARYTVCGAASLLEQSDEDAARLRINVTSPKGTTEAALKILMRQDGLEKLMRDAVHAAMQRSKELAGDGPAGAWS